MSERVMGGTMPAAGRTKPTGAALLLYRFKKYLATPTPYLTCLGIFLWVFTYWVLSEGLEVWRFVKMPGPVAILKDWLAFEPFQGISIFTAEYYEHIYMSTRRIFIAFCIATGVGVPLGLFMGWSRAFRHYTFPIL